MSDQINFRPLTEEHDPDVMSIQAWLDMVNAKAFIDTDGFGELANKDYISDIEVKPSDFYQQPDKQFPTWCTCIVWYNR